jgi:ribosomal protein S18 acetylase RimI-like enzyme
VDHECGHQHRPPHDTGQLAGVEIRRLGEKDAAAYWNLRLESLLKEPFAFGKAAEEHQATAVEATAIRFRDMPVDSFTLGAFEAGELIGIATFIRESGLKERHKGRIYGIYVTASHRGRGAGYALITAVLHKAKEDPSLEQILLAVASGQIAAVELYRKCGFEVYGTEPRALKVDSEYIDEHHMILRRQ